jgi:hypothetical protein
MVPRRTAADRSQAIARLDSRGFRYRGEIVRKAAVVLFQ